MYTYLLYILAATGGFEPGPPTCIAVYSTLAPKRAGGLADRQINKKLAVTQLCTYLCDKDVTRD